MEVEVAELGKAVAVVVGGNPMVEMVAHYECLSVDSYT